MDRLTDTRTKLTAHEYTVPILFLLCACMHTVAKYILASEECGLH